MIQCRISELTCRNSKNQICYQEFFHSKEQIWFHRHFCQAGGAYPWYRSVPPPFWQPWSSLCHQLISYASVVSSLATHILPLYTLDSQESTHSYPCVSGGKIRHHWTSHPDTWDILLRLGSGLQSTGRNGRKQSCHSGDSLPPSNASSLGSALPKRERG